MFDQTFVNAHAQARKPWTVALSLTLQSGLVALAVIIPMLNPEILRPKPLDMPIYLPMRATPQPPPLQAVKAQGASASPRVFTEPPLMAAPRTIPPHAGMIADEAPGFSLAGAVSGGPYMGIPGISEGLPPRVAPLPEPKPAPIAKPPVPAGPVHVSTGVQAARLVFSPKPAYPPLARTTRSQGTVKIEAIIAADGVIKNLHVLSGPPLLVKAALDAVQQWRYQPTMLSGNAVEVITEIDVIFTLNQ